MATAAAAVAVYYSVFIFIHLFSITIPPALAIHGTSKTSLHGSRLEELRRVSRQTSRGNGNGLLDEALPEWQQWLQENGYDPLIIKQYDISLDEFLVKLKDCNIVGLSTIRRAGDVTVNLTEAGFSGQGEIGLARLSADCGTQIRWSLLRINGKLKFDVVDFNIDASIVQIRPPPRITSLRITNLGSLDVEFTGDGFTGSLFQWLVQGYLKYRLQRFLANTERVIAIANEALEGVDVENIVTAF